MSSIQNILESVDLLYKRQTTIQGIFKTNYGYDFDGVLHISVTQPDKTGQRHAKIWYGPYHAETWYGPYKPFKKIIEKIKNNLSDGDNVYIITARSSDSQPTINKFLEDNNLSELKDKVYYTDNQDKTVVLNNLQINEFYDDSCLRINELSSKMKNNLLPHLKKLYFVEPEKLSWIEASDEIIKKECEKYK